MAKRYDLGQRTLPSFDNHYNSGVLIDNWLDARIYEETGRVFTLAMDHPLQPPLSLYKADYTCPIDTSIQPMMRKRGLGKELMFGTGHSRVFDGAPTSTIYGASQRHLIDSKYSKTRCPQTPSFDTVRDTPRHTFGTITSTAQIQPTADDDLNEQYSSTKQAMDLSVACHHFQSQNVRLENPFNKSLMYTN